MWDALSDERTGLPFTIAAGPRQRSHSRVLVPWVLRSYFTVSNLRLHFRRLYNSQGSGGGIRPRLHISSAGVLVMNAFGTDHLKNTQFPRVSPLLHVDLLPWERVCFAVVT
jgi:hypothetical protein